MMNNITKIKLLVGNIINVVQRVKMRGIIDSVRILDVSTKLIFNPNNQLYDKWHRLNMKFLRKTIKSMNVEFTPPHTNLTHRYYIWTLWWQGEDNMPEVVKICVDSIRRASNKEVIVVDKNNYTKYISLPAEISNRVNRNQIGLAHLSDYIRVSLLCKYGGLWIDSTVFCVKPIPDYVFNSDFFTVRAKSTSHKYIPKGKWNMQILGSNQLNCPVFLYMKYYLENYWKLYNKDIEYLFFDYGMQLLYEDNSKAKQLIDNVPFSNPEMHQLLPLLNVPFDGDKWNLMTANTWWFKLTYKHVLSEKCNEMDTFYKYVKNRSV